MITTRKIAFLCHPYHRGGVTRWMADAAIDMAGSGHEVYFITVAPNSVFHSAGGRETMVTLLTKEQHNINILAEPAGYEFEFGTPTYRSWVYEKLILKLPPGTPIILSDDAAVWAAANHYSRSYPIVGVLHGDQDYFYNLGAQYRQDLSLFICVSNRIKRKLTIKYPDVDPGKTFTIPCGIDITPVNVSVIRTSVLRLIFIGRLSDYEKRAADLVKISGKLKEHGTDFHLDIVGNDDKSKISFLKDFTEAGASQNVSFHGWLPKEKINVLLAGADILLLTSNSEGMPLVMMEAFAAGCGMVGTRVSGVEDYESHPLATSCLGIYTVGETDDAVKKIEAIASVPLNVRQSAARTLAETEFSMQTCVEKYFQAIDTISQHTVSPAPSRLSTRYIVFSRLVALARYLKVRTIKK